MLFTPFRILLLVLLASATFAAREKPRFFVLTDIGGEPDDQKSLVRLRTYANHLDVEGLVATPPGGETRPVNPQYLHRIVGAYGEVRDKLRLNEPGYPTLAQRSVPPSKRATT